MALLPRSSDEALTVDPVDPTSADANTTPAAHGPPTTGVAVGTLGDLMARRTARDRRLLWKRLGLAASGTFTLAAAITVVTGAALRQPPAPTPSSEPAAQPRPELGSSPGGTRATGPMVNGPIVAPEAAPPVPTASAPPISLADGGASSGASAGGSPPGTSTVDHDGGQAGGRQGDGQDGSGQNDRRHATGGTPGGGWNSSGTWSWSPAASPWPGWFGAMEGDHDGPGSDARNRNRDGAGHGDRHGGGTGHGGDRDGAGGGGHGGPRRWSR